MFAYTKKSDIQALRLAKQPCESGFRKDSTSTENDKPSGRPKLIVMCEIHKIILNDLVVVLANSLKAPNETAAHNVYDNCSCNFFVQIDVIHPEINKSGDKKHDLDL